MSVTYNEDGYPIFSGGEDFVYASEFKGKTITDLLSNNGCIVDCKGIESITRYKLYDANITELINIGDLKTIETYAFYVPSNSSRKGIGTKVLNFENVTSIASNAFYGNSLIEKMYFPKLTGLLDSNTFYNCTSLNEINLGEKITMVGSGAFYQCGSIKNIELPATITAIGQNAFYQCTNLESLIIRQTKTLVTLANVSAFTGTKLLDGGKVYVPSNLLSNYNSASGQWATFRNNGGQFAAIEE